jgi:multidrug efflux system outer membrane protein
MSNKIYILFLLLIGLFYMQACKVGPSYQKMEVPTESSYRYDSSGTAADTVLNIRWWNNFNDPILDTLIRIALEENKDVLIAASRVEESRAKLGFTKADMWPQLSYAAIYNNGNFVNGQPIDQGQFGVGGVSLNWEIDFWGKYRRANESERAKLLSNEFALRAVQMSLISSVASAYYTLLDYQMRILISKKTLSLRDSSLYIMEQRFDKGIIPEIDVNQAEIQRAIAAAAVPLYERSLGQTENALSVLLGLNPSDIPTDITLTNQDLPNEIPIGVPSTILRRRPDILQAEQDVVAQNALIGVAVAQRFPSISITGLLGVATTDFTSLLGGGATWQVGASLLGPLFYFNKNKRRVDIERARTEQSIYSYERTVLNAFREVDDALISIETIKRELIEREKQVIAAINARELSAQRYDRGVTSYLEVLETQRGAFDAELQYSNVLRTLFTSYVDLYNALGGGWLSEAEEELAKQQAAAEEAEAGN